MAGAGGKDSMLTFLLKRLGLVLPTFIGITLLVFSLIRLLSRV